MDRQVRVRVVNARFHTDHRILDTCHDGGMISAFTAILCRDPAPVLQQL